MAVKTQDKFNKLFSSNGSSSNDNTETKSNENRGLLHTYLTKVNISFSNKYSRILYQFIFNHV